MKKEGEKPKKQTDDASYTVLGIALGMCFGTSLGCTFGILFHEIGIFICFGIFLGMGFGMLIGALLDYKVRERQKEE